MEWRIYSGLQLKMNAIEYRFRPPKKITDGSLDTTESVGQKMIGGTHAIFCAGMANARGYIFSPIILHFWNKLAKPYIYHTPDSFLKTMEM